MQKREKKKEQSRHKLLVCAAKCFAEKGFDGCSVSDIARVANISQGGLYAHFAGKEDLFKCMISREHQDAADQFRKAAAENPSLESLMEILVKCIRDVGFPMDHRLWVEMLAVSARNEAIRAVFLESDRILRDALVDLIKGAARRGEIDETLDFESLSVWIYALVDGLIARTADDSNFDFKSHLATFDLLVRRAIGAKTPER